jgi:hypothetical protein
MGSDRRAILTLIAMGRITPREAERLLAAWNEGREMWWIAAGCLVAAVVVQLHGTTLAPGSFDFLGQGLKVLTHWVGGL